jgi:hypothetical protein
MPFKYYKSNDQLNILESAILRAMGAEYYKFEIKGKQKQYTTSNRYKTWGDMRTYELEQLERLARLNTLLFLTRFSEIQIL